MLRMCVSLTSSILLQRPVFYRDALPPPPLAHRYGEYYEEMRQFHLQLPRLLKPRGVYSYFNGLASDNFFFHMVYGRWV